MLGEITETTAGLRQIVSDLRQHVERRSDQTPPSLTIEQLAKMLLVVTTHLIDLNNDTAALRIANAPKLSGS